MNRYFNLTVAAGVVMTLLAACGGSSGSSGSSSGGSSVSLSGTAATGFALVSSSVDVKCASGTGTATTNDAGGYTVTVTNGSLPCIVKVTGTSASGVPVTLHSVAEAGTTSGSTTMATANVTPLTELIVAQLAGSLPGAYFDNFGAGTTVTGTQLATATSTLLTALKDATGIDLGTIDPFKSTLVPATLTTGGNAYDDALEALQLKVSLETLPLVVNQVASAAATTTATAPITLAEVLTAANAGTLANCPSALSGKYRVIDYRGATQIVELDFSRNKVVDGTTELDIIPNTSQACEFAVNDGNGTRVVFGPQGVAALHDNFTTGYVFPVQSTALADLLGNWNFVESGQEESGQPVHFMGKATFNSGGSVNLCEYDLSVGLTSSSICEPDTDVITAASAPDGGFALNYGGSPSAFYGYRAPNGTLVFFGTNNPNGDAAGPTVLATHYVLYKPQTVVMPTLNSERKTWDLLMSRAKTNTTGALSSNSVVPVAQTITAVDDTAGTYSRVRDVAPTVTDVFTINSPFDGMVSRSVRPIYAFNTGVGFTIAIDAASNTNFLYSTTVNRP